MSRRFLALLAFVGAMAVLTTGCTAIIIGGPTVATRSPTTGPGTPTGSVTPTGPTPTPVTGPKGAATLTKAPTGQATLTFDPNTRNLTIQTMLTGLAPNSAHVMNIRTGNCVSTGPVIIPLPNVTADGAGNINATSTMMVDPATQPSSGWYIEVTNGTGSNSFDTLNLVCANIGATQGGAGAPITSVVKFTQGVGPSMNASGNATFTVASAQLTVVLTMHGLEAGSQHAAFVSQGTCQNQSSQTFHGLSPVSGDNAGNGTSKTTITNVQSVPGTTWYVVVTRGTNLNTPIDAAPIACGNVTVTQ
jgi:hypothetical protein